MRFAEPEHMRVLLPVVRFVILIGIAIVSYLNTNNCIVESYIFNHHYPHSHPRQKWLQTLSSQLPVPQQRWPPSNFLPKTTKKRTWLFNSIDKNNNSDMNDPWDDDRDDSVSGIHGNPLEEETLLRISMMALPQVPSPPSMICDYDNNNAEHVLQQQQQQDHAIEQVSKFCEAFPFAAILPVQPLQYFPIDIPNNDYYNVTTKLSSSIECEEEHQTRKYQRRRCVEIQFLRKKTPERGSIDGGIRFYIQPIVHNSACVEENYDEHDDDSGDDDSDRLRQQQDPMIELIAKRNGQGQVITKIFAEKLIITNFVASFLGTTKATTEMMNTEANTETTSSSVVTPTAASKTLLNLPLRYPSPIVENIVQLQSIYHKWM